MSDDFEQRVAALEERLEKQDEMLARLLGGLGHLWSGLEALIGLTLDGKPEEEREAFEASLRWYTSELWKAIHASATDVARGDPEDTGAVGDVPGG